MWNSELEDHVAYNPISALESARERRDVIKGIVPSGGITWLYGPSMSFKSFAAMSAAAAVAMGVPWLGRRTEQSAVLYLGAEGGDALHIRRAAAEMAISTGKGGDIVIAQERPSLDKPSGLWLLRGVLVGVCFTLWGVDPDALFWEASSNEVARDSRFVEADREFRSCQERYTDLRRRQANREGGLGAAMSEATKRRAEAFTAREEARTAAGANSTGLRAMKAARDRYTTEHTSEATEHRNLLCIIDTYSQTAEDDNRTNVSSYIKNLRSLIEGLQEQGITLSFIVIDHVTKEGSTYLGSVAKLNDVDSQLELSRIRKTMLATLSQTKSKNAAEGPELNLELSPFVLDGYQDADGDDLVTLVVKDGTAAAAALALNPDGNAAMLAEILEKAEGIMPEADLKASFREAKMGAGVKGPSADKAYRRALQALKDGDRVREIDGEISLA